MYLLLRNYDVIGLNEVKTDERVTLPGYVCYRKSKSTDGHRGGTVVFVKRFLQPFVMCVDFEMNDQVWIKLSLMSTVLFGFIYVPPADSHYFNPSSFSYIQEKIVSGEEENCSVLLMGDMNTRFGSSVRNIIDGLPICCPEQYTYPVIPDRVNSTNENASIMSTVCVEQNLIVINNLKFNDMYYASNLTYRKRNDWVSELDVCIVSCNILQCIKEFSVNNDLSLPSDHAPIAIVLSPPSVDRVSLGERARYLGDHATLYTTCNNSQCKRPIKFSNISQEGFCGALSRYNVPGLDDVNVAVENCNGVLYKCAKAGKCIPRDQVVDSTVSRWERLLRDTDDRRMWQAIDWQGRYRSDDFTEQNNICPTDEEFINHFADVFNPQGVEPVDGLDFATNVTIPVLDNDIAVDEVVQEIKKLKQDKACGPDGISPGIFKLLPAEWIYFIVSVFNAIFSGSYPASWHSARMITLFKKGNRALTKNYRSINIINSMAKLYDMVLSSRLSQWFAPYREQAGSQQGRGCIEHIVTLRLLMDFARRKKQRLFVCFVDFSMAYDRVPRAGLFRMLRDLGCGARMLAALAAMYAVTFSVLGKAVLESKIGVRQGSPTSCLLFVLYVNSMIHVIKRNCEPDGFLQWLHLLMLMDDTVFLSTTRRGMQRKLVFLNEFCINNGMKVNNTKTKFFTINPSEHDREPFHVGDIEVQWCDRYTYLGSVFTSDGSLSSAIAAHAKSKTCQILKFVSFLKKNTDVPFYVRKRIFDAALMSSVLYGCESWFNGDLRPIEKLYNWGMKQLLGVRVTACTEMCYVELGYPTVKALIQAKQRKFFQLLWGERHGSLDDPWAHAVRLTLASNTPTARYIYSLIHDSVDDVKLSIENLKSNIIRSVSSRRISYLVMNPSLIVHHIYNSRGRVNEIHRIAFSRLRVISHNLAIETGRWNRRGRGRLEVSERLCPCGAVQTELHVLEVCPLTRPVRDLYNFTSWSEIIDGDAECLVAEIVYKVLSCFG